MTKEEGRQHIIETCGHGWLNLVDILYDNKPDPITVDEVFQKWGGLKMDYKGEDEDFDSLCDAIYTVSKHMCEICGKSAQETVVDGWETTLCDEHYQTHEASQKYRHKGPNENIPGEEGMNRAAAHQYLKEYCGEGWLILADVLYDNQPAHITIDEIYQKWGCLEIDYTGEDENFQYLYEAIHTVSEKMCETCGKSARQSVMNNVQLALCPEHFDTCAAREKHYLD